MTGFVRGPCHDESKKSKSSEAASSTKGLGHRKSCELAGYQPDETVILGAGVSPLEANMLLPTGMDRVNHYTTSGNQYRLAPLSEGRLRRLGPLRPRVEVLA